MLAAAYEKGMPMPENIFLTRDGRAKILHLSAGQVGRDPKTLLDYYAE